jgi:hypothetical protein
VPTADTASSIVITKSFTFQGSTKRWSNRYHVTGPLSIGATAFATLADAVVADELDMYAGNITIVEASWSDASTASSTNPHGITTQTKTYSSAGAHSFTNPRNVPGEVAALLRYSTTQRSTKNHPVYLFNYFHGVFNAIAGDVDTLLPEQQTLIEEYGTDWLAGFSDGTNTRVRCGPRGAVAQARTVKPLLTHRDFPT